MQLEPGTRTVRGGLMDGYEVTTGKHLRKALVFSWVTMLVFNQRLHR